MEYCVRLIKSLYLAVLVLLCQSSFAERLFTVDALNTVQLSQLNGLKQQNASFSNLTASQLQTISGKAPIPTIRLKGTSKAGINFSNAQFATQSIMSEATNEVILVNSRQGKSVALRNLSGRLDDMRLTPLLLAELANAGLGEAETYECYAVERTGNGGLNLIDSCVVERPTTVKMPLLRYVTDQGVKDAATDERRIVSVYRNSFQLVFTDRTPVEEQKKRLFCIIRKMLRTSVADDPT